MTRELTSAAGVLDNANDYLNLRIMSGTLNSAAANNSVVARAYNAYIDIVPPRPRPGSFVDPTVDPNNPTVNLTGTTPSETAPELTLPLAPGTGVVRYFIGLRYPYTTRTPSIPTPYVNRYEGMTVPSGATPVAATLSNSSVVTDALNNPYVLYRAGFQPNNADGTVNETLFAADAPNGKPIVNDPDFFRIVTANDTDPATGNPYSATASAAYTGATPADPNGDPDYITAHNNRVIAWTKLAKLVIADQNIDLLALHRTVGGRIVYETDTASPDYNLPTEGFVTVGSGVTAISYPTVRTTVSFGPGQVANDTLAPSVSGDTSQGSAAYASYTPNNLPYVPTQYKAAYGLWQGTPGFTINRADDGTAGATLNTAPFTTVGTFPATAPSLVTPNFTGATAASATDLMLYNNVGNPVYDITVSTPVAATGTNNPVPDFLALSFNANKGLVNFALSALPNPQYSNTDAMGIKTYNPAYTNPYWTSVAGSPTTGPPVPINISSANGYQLDLKTLANAVTFPTGSANLFSPLTTAPNAGVPNARLVFNSERVMGPDMSIGVLGATSATLPAVTSWVPYTRVAYPTNIGPNQYYVDYSTGILTFSLTAPPTAGDTTHNDVEVAFSYQNNLGTTDPTQFAYTAATVQASYLTAATIQLNFGVRVYDSATSVSAYFALNSRIAVANMKA